MKLKRHVNSLLRATSVTIVSATSSTPASTTAASTSSFVRVLDTSTTDLIGMTIVAKTIICRFVTIVHRTGIAVAVC